MKPELFIGKTLSEVAEMTHIFWKEIHAFVHADKEDVAGIRLQPGYTVQQVIDAHPNMASAVIFDAYNYHGETILRVLPAKEGAKHE